MAEIVNRFETAIEAFPLANESQNDTTLNDTMVSQNAGDTQIDQSEDDSFYRSEFKSSVVEPNARSPSQDDVDDECFVDA